MKVLVFHIALFLTITPFSVCIAQDQVKVAGPWLEQKDGNVEIYYDILNSKKSQRFVVWLDITDSYGNKINARALTGDIGEGIRGGAGKMISWNMEADQVFLDGGIFVVVNAQPLPEKEIKRGGVLIQSAVFPGWGLSRMQKGKPHWLKGVAGYGCIAVSVGFNMQAVSNYDKYIIEDVPEERNLLYDKSLKQDNLSEVFAYTAMAIWVTDFIWTLAASSKLKQNKGSTRELAWSVKPAYDLQTGSGLLVFRYNFY